LTAIHGNMNDPERMTFQHVNPRQTLNTLVSCKMYKTWDLDC